MLSERALSRVVKEMGARCLRLAPMRTKKLPVPKPGHTYMLYAHVPFCERLCPYCSFNRFPYERGRAVSYFEDLRTEMRTLHSLGYDFDTLYIGGGTPTIMIDELCATIDLAHELFSIEDVSTETNPNHLVPEILEPLSGRIQRLSVGVQSASDDLLRAMDRYDKYGSSAEILERIQHVAGYPFTFNVDRIFNFPAQTVDMLIHDLAFVIESGCSQATFYPLMASPSVERKLLETVGRVDYARERRFYDMIWRALTDAGFGFSSVWTFNRYEDVRERAGAGEKSSGEGVGEFGRTGEGPGGEGAGKSAHTGEGANGEGAGKSVLVDEYVVKNEEYPAIGSGGITYLGNTLYVNTFSLKEYHAAIQSGRLSLMGQATFGKRDQMRYRFMMQLFGLRLDKRQFKADFGTSVEAGLPAEMAFMRTNRAFATDDETELTLTPNGRYLLVAMMRQFFISVNTLRDQARATLPPEERQLLFGAGIMPLSG